MCYFDLLLGLPQAVGDVEVLGHGVGAGAGVGAQGNAGVLQTLLELTK